MKTRLAIVGLLLLCGACARVTPNSPEPVAKSNEAPKPPPNREEVKPPNGKPIRDPLVDPDADAKAEAARKADEEAKRKADAVKRKADEDAKRKADEDAKRKADEDARAAEAAKSKVNRENYDKIKVVMYLEDVRDLLGPSHSETTEGDFLIVTWKSKPVSPSEEPTIITVRFRGNPNGQKTCYYNGAKTFKGP